MDTLLFVLSFVFGLLTLVGLVSPKKVLRNSENPSRGKVLLFCALPSIVLFIGFGVLYESDWDKALKNPQEAKQVSLKYKRLEELPVELQEMTGLVKLNLAKNNLSTLPAYLKDFDDLEELDLSENPIQELPSWIGEMKSLSVLNLDGTQIEALPTEVKGLQVSYSETPLYLAENPPSKASESTKSDEEPVKEEENDDHSESLGEFAMRQFLGKDYGARRKFKKGEIYYNPPVNKDQVDIIGEMMIMMEFFNDERESSMLIDQNSDGILELKIVVVSEEALTKEVMDAFASIEEVIQQDVFPDDELYLVLTDREFSPIRTIK